LVVLLAACPAPQTAAVLPSPVATWDGDYNLVQVDGKTRSGSESWVTSAGVRFGAEFDDDGWQVMEIDDHTFTAMPGGLRSIEMKEVSVGRYAGDTDGVAYTKAGDILQGKWTRNGADRIFTYSRFNGEAAPELEAADTAFAAAVGERGIDAWVEAFEPGGAQMGKKGRIAGADAIRARMSDTLAKGKLTWAPTTSRRHGDWGFTVGLSSYDGDDKWKGTYITIWHHQPDGSWKVAFDTGAAVHE